VEIYHRFLSKSTPNYQYRILIDKNLIVETEEKKAEGPAKDIFKEKEDDFYEKTSYGYLPKISPEGATVFEAYSARAQRKSMKKLRLVVLVADGKEVERGLDSLKDQRITFVVPPYIENLENVVEQIRRRGHEFFLIMPTQTSLPAGKAMSPFLANDDENMDRLLRLLSSAKYALGIANVSPTLLTKSKKDMTRIAETLKQRGLAFLDLEKSNDLVRSVFSSIGGICINVDQIFTTETFDISQIKDGEIMLITMNFLEKLLHGLPADWQLTPVSEPVRQGRPR
jgi:hypothetical protein